MCGSALFQLDSSCGKRQVVKAPEELLRFLFCFFYFQQISQLTKSVRVRRIEQLIIALEDKRVKPPFLISTITNSLHALCDKIHQHVMTFYVNVRIQRFSFYSDFA